MSRTVVEKSLICLSVVNAPALSPAAASWLSRCPTSPPPSGRPRSRSLLQEQIMEIVGCSENTVYSVVTLAGNTENSFYLILSKRLPELSVIFIPS